MKNISLALIVIALALGNLFGQTIELNFERTINIGETITPQTASRVIRQIRVLDSQTSNEPIFIRIFSTGGETEATLAICQTMKNTRHDIVTVGQIMCYSGGAMILSSGTQGRRYLIEGTKVMIHANRLVSATCCAAPIIASPINKLYTWLIKKLRLSTLFPSYRGRREAVFELLAENTGKTFEEISYDLRKDKWLTARGAVNYGLADQIINYVASR